MKRLLVLSLLLIGCQTSSAQAEKGKDKAKQVVVKFDKTRTLAVKGAVSGNMFALASQMLNLAQPEAVDKKDIYVIINSGGGSVLAGEVFINSMKIAQSRGYKINCGVSFVAASMAFSILDACDKRYLLESSKVLFHSAAIGPIQRVNMFDAQQILMQLSQINGKLIARLLESTGMNEEVFALAFYQEKLWDADEFQGNCKSGYIEIATDYQGVENMFDFK